MAQHENKKFPYKSARFVDGLKKYVEFSVWDNEKKKLVRKRLYKGASEELAKQVNIDLEKENIYVPSNIEIAIAEKEQKKQNETAINALQKALNNSIPRLRKRSISRYKSHINSFCNFLEQNYKTLAIRELQQWHVNEFLNVTQETRKISNRTRNAYGSSIRVMLSDLQQIDYVDKNVMQGFRNLKESKSTAHKFYTTEQKKRLKEVISVENPNLWLVCQIIYYTFIRPSEIRFLKVGNIETDTGKIFIPAGVSKNLKNERITIPTHLMQALLKSGFLSYNSDYYLFGIDGIPSSKATKESQFSKEYSKIRDRLRFSKDYTLYSWKHTGVVTSYQNGFDILTISQQCRHHDLDQTKTYLRGLGLYSSEKIKNDFPEL